MIGKRELLDMASATGLNPHIVEKDYVLGWTLAGVFAHPDLHETWIFKGGTCLKKCYFETYRFSEDLDFTLLDASHLDEAYLHRVFGEISEWMYERTGLDCPTGDQTFELVINPGGNVSCQGKLSYRGPVSPSGSRSPRIKLDLTADECVVMNPVQANVFHPYSDEPVEHIKALTYTYEEVFGEKVRALAERTRPRDLYDVINMYRNQEARPSPAVLRDVVRQKCEFKGIQVPRSGDLDDHREDLAGAWKDMLGHQLPDLPAMQMYWNALPEFFAWLETGATTDARAAYTMAPGETVMREHTFRLPVSVAQRSHLEIIRFAAANHLCVDLDYLDQTRRIEPYSLRRTKSNNIILHAWNVDRDEHRSYRVDRIEGARMTNQGFTPRYLIELTPKGPMSIPSTSHSRH